MSTVSNNLHPAPVNGDEALPESVMIGGYRFDVRIPDQAMLDDPKLGTFIDGLHGVFTPSPMAHGGSVWLHPDHDHHVLEHIVVREEERLAQVLESRLRADARLAQRRAAAATQKYEDARADAAAYDVLGGPF